MPSEILPDGTVQITGMPDGPPDFHETATIVVRRLEHTSGTMLLQIVGIGGMGLEGKVGLLQLAILQEYDEAKGGHS